ncbi:MAG: RluA family pseudouridine synthase [Clostridia bacterium]|nr:RluA family pseudouridine synthase [Clostridia bacterium]
MTYEDITILYEDNHLLVVIKPQGVPSQSDKSGDEDMLSLLKAYIKEKYAKPGNVYLGLVHRLDRPTGGVMVFAKTSKAAARITEQIKDGTFSKRYLAVLTAKPQIKRSRLTHYLLKDQANNIVKVVPMTTTGAKKAVLDYNIIEDSDEEGLCLADIRLHTGRSHQIRVQMSTVGCPLYGDVKYGKNQPNGVFSLWAYDLSFKHPTTDKTMSFRVFPEDKHPWKLFNLDKHIGIVKPRD